MIGQNRDLKIPVLGGNPANEVETSTGARKRIPMSIPTLRLQVPDMPGYHLHWMRNDPQRLEQALKAGYEFVDERDVELNRTGVASGGMDSGNQDLGSRVSLAAGAEGVRLFLMKLPQAFWDEDTDTLAARQEQIAATLRGDKGFSEGGQDLSNRYSRREQANYLKPKALQGR